MLTVIIIIAMVAFIVWVIIGVQKLNKEERIKAEEKAIAEAKAAQEWRDILSKNIPPDDFLENTNRKLRSIDDRIKNIVKNKVPTLMEDYEVTKSRARSNLESCIKEIKYSMQRLSELLKSYPNDSTIISLIDTAIKIKNNAELELGFSQPLSDS